MNQRAIGWKTSRCTFVAAALAVMALIVEASDAAAPVVAPALASAVQSRTLIIRDVTLIDGIGDQARPAMSVVVIDGRISAVGRAVEISVADGVEVIDGRGRFLIPGLWDTHAHLSYWGEDALQMLVNAGVTSIRELGGDLDEIDAWKREIEDGARIGPTMVWCGPFIEGPDGDDEYRLKVATEDEARYAARALDARGVDFIKIQPLIEPSLVAALIDEGADLGLSVVGHLPRGVGAVAGSNMGLRSIEHMSPYMRLNDEELDLVFRTYLANGTWMSPALFSLVAPVEARGDDPARDDRIRTAYRIVRAAHGSGVPILVGSNFAYRDWPQTPANGLHGEMRSLVAAGLSTMEVLKLATARAAEFNGAAQESGTIRAGLSADMVLLDADPLADIGNVGRIHRVILRGRVITPS